MTTLPFLLKTADQTAGLLNRAAPVVVPSLARFAFAAVLTGYFWSSASTKFDGLFTPSVGAYAQIFPKAFEDAGYNTAALGPWHGLVALFGGWSEFLLPLLLLLGLMTRLAAVGMIGFIVVQSLTDILGHGADAATIGMLFDRVPDAAILDTRLLWLVPLIALVFLGAGPLSTDHLLRKFLHSPQKQTKSGVSEPMTR